MTATVQTLEAMERPPVSMGSRLEGELLEVSMGPQHPSTHGVFRMNVALEGEIVRKLKPVFGYLHRNHEKIGENATYLSSMPYTDRLDYFCSMTNNWAYALSVEKLAGIEVPERAENVGKLSPELAINAGSTGPMLRACGVNYDVRKVDGYGIYPRFKFRIPLGDHGDTYDRLMMRALEMHESVEILKQALAQIQPGPVVNPKVKLRAFRPPVGEAYGRIEGPKGELGFYLISDGGANPYRYRVRPPSFINLTVLEDLCLGHTVADVMVILGSVDIVMGEVDR